MGNDNSEGSKPKGKEMAIKSKKKEKKYEEREAWKRKTKLDQLDMIGTKDPRTRRKLRVEKPQVPAEATQPEKTLVYENDEKCQPTKQPPRRKMPAKKLKTQQSTTPAHYPFISTKVKKLFTDII